MERFKSAGPRSSIHSFSLLASFKADANQTEDLEELSKACQEVRDVAERLSQLPGMRVKLTGLATEIEAQASTLTSKRLKKGARKRPRWGEAS